MQSFEKLIDELVQSARDGGDIVSIKPIIDIVAQSYPTLTKNILEERVMAAILRAGSSVYWDDPRERMPRSNGDDVSGSEA